MLCPRNARVSETNDCFCLLTSSTSPEYRATIMVRHRPLIPEYGKDTQKTHIYKKKGLDLATSAAPRPMDGTQVQDYRFKSLFPVFLAVVVCDPIYG